MKRKVIILMVLMLFFSFGVMLACDKGDKSYKVEFVNFDGTVLQREILKQGEMPEYKGEIPQRPFDGEFEYTFIGWSPKIVKAESAATYVAQFIDIIAKDYQRGDGSKNNPYIIVNEKQLKYFADKVNGGEKYTDTYFALGADIDLRGAEWTPIGTSFYVPFKGNFDGRDFVVKNFKITSPIEYAGLFGYNMGVIQNTGVTDLTIDINGIDFDIYDVYAGGLTGYNYYDTKLKNCYVAGDITVISTYSVYAGGLVGETRNAIENCYATVNVSATATKYSAYAGGLVGGSAYATITNCHATGNVIATATVDAYAGGLVGYNGNFGTITDCYATGSVEVNSPGSSACAGGLVGYNYRTIKNCYATGDVTVTSIGDYVYAGGLVGENRGTITDCHADGIVTANTSSDIEFVYTYAGGLVGYNSGAITDCHASGEVSIISNCSNLNTSAYTGGLVGYNSGTITDCHASGEITITSIESVAYAGGLVGSNIKGTITNCFSTGNVTVDSGQAGGLAGYNSGTITRCYATGDVSATATSVRPIIHVGGLVGNNFYGTITDCYATGNVSATTDYFVAYAGGLLGLSGFGKITNCYATGDVSVSATVREHFVYAGGLIGQNNSTITSCYATGDVTATTNYYVDAGGLIGNNSNVGITNCYRYDGQAFYRKEGANEYDTADNTVGEECSKADLNNSAFYTEVLGWNNNVSVWDFSGLDFDAGKLPRLIGFDGGSL